MDKKILPCRNKGHEFYVPLLKKDKTPSKRKIKMRVHTVFKFSDKVFEYYLERYSEKTNQWVLENRLFKHQDIKQYF
jgi:hypothetical protein